MKTTRNTVPRRSPYGLIQEDLLHDPWLLLVSCMFLNQTGRKQVERVWRPFVAFAPNASVLLTLEPGVIRDIISSLGFKNRRTATLYRMSEAYLTTPWRCASELPGCGPYATGAYDIFILGHLGEAPPADHKLTEFWHWAKKQEGHQ